MRYIWLIGLLVFSLPTSSHMKPKANLNTFTKLKEQMQQLVQGQGPTPIAGLQLVLIKNRQIVFEYAKGFASINPNGQKSPLKVDHKVRVASISKFILTMALMSLVDDGRVALDQDVSAYLGFSLRNPHFPDAKITVQQLLSHTSSIRDDERYFLPLEQRYQDFFRPSAYFDNGRHFATAPKQGPGDYFNYANLNFGLLAGIIENVSGQRVDRFVKQVLFEPLGLTSSFNLCDLSDNQFSQLATLYRRGEGGHIWQPEGPWLAQVDGEELRCFYSGPTFKRSQLPDLGQLNQYTLGVNPTIFSPQGGLRASATDLAMLMQVILSRIDATADKTIDSASVISTKSIKRMLSPAWQFDPQRKNGNTHGENSTTDVKSRNLMTTFGLSTHIIDLKQWRITNRPKKLYGHLGSAYGLQGQFWFDPISGDGLVALITGLGDDPAKPVSNTPLYAIEQAVLSMALEGLGYKIN